MMQIFFIGRAWQIFSANTFIVASEGSQGPGIGQNGLLAELSLYRGDVIYRRVLKRFGLWLTIHRLLGPCQWCLGKGQHVLDDTGGTWRLSRYATNRDSS